MENIENTVQPTSHDHLMTDENNQNIGSTRNGQNSKGSDDQDRQDSDGNYVSGPRTRLNHLSGSRDKSVQDSKPQSREQVQGVQRHNNRTTIEKDMTSVGKDDGTNDPSSGVHAALPRIGQAEDQGGIFVSRPGHIPAGSFSSSATGSQAQARSKNKQRQIAFNADDSTRLNNSYLEDVLAIGSATRIDSNITPAMGDFQRRPLQPVFGQRHQSVDVAHHARGRIQPPATVLGIPKGSVDPTQLSSVSLSGPPVMYDEIKKSNLIKLSKLMDPYLVAKLTAGSHTGRETQQKNRNIKNTFQTFSKQTKSPDNKSGLAKDSQGAVGPRQPINVPRPLVVHQLSKQLDTSVLERTRSGQTAVHTRDDPSSVSFLDQLLAGGPRIPETTRAGDKGILSGLELKSRRQSGIHAALGKTPSSPKTLRLNEGPGTFVTSVPGGVSSRKNLAPSGPIKPTKGLTNFQITDLLERSVRGGSGGAEHSKLRQVVDLYKRQLKTDKEIGAKPRLVIRNYRIQAVRDEAKELGPEVMRVATLNKGTTIPTFNSVIRPEIHKFGTKVTDMVEEAYAALLNPQKHLIEDNDEIYHGELVELPYQEMMDQNQFEQEMGIHGGEHVNIESNQPHSDERTLPRRTAQSKSRGSKYIPPQRSEDAGERPLSGNIEGLPEGLSSRSFTPYGQEDLEAVEAVNRVFDRWLRCIMTAKSAAEAAPKRRLLAHGQYEPRSIPDVNWHIDVVNGSRLKPRPVSLDAYSGTSIIDPGPYRELQMLVINQDIREWYSRFILQTQKIATYSQIAQQELQAMRFGECKVAIDFARHHLSHLDPCVFRDDHVPAELFLDYDGWIKPLAKEVWALKQENELRGDEWIGLPAQTHWSRPGKQNAMIDVHVIDYDPVSARFLVKNRELKLDAWRSRLYLSREEDKGGELDAARSFCAQMRTESLHYLRVQRVVTNDLAKRYNYLRLSNEVLQKIQQKLRIDPYTHNPDSVRKIIVQIEALYVFSVLKSTLASQATDPFIKGLLLRHKIPPKSPALHPYIPVPILKKDLDGLQDYNIKAMKVELDHNSLLLTNKKYIKLPLFLNSITKETIGTQSLFSFPFNPSLLLAQEAPELRKANAKALDKDVNTFPLQHSKFVLAEKLMAHHFHQVAKFKWVEAIQKEMWEFIKDDFDFPNGQELQMEQIDPALVRLFYQVKAYMQSVIVETFEKGLRDYTNFLLSFVLRDPDMRTTKCVKEIQFNPLINLGLTGDQQNANLLPGEIINDTELIRLHKTPMIHISALIADLEVPGKIHKKQKVQTRPELDAVSQDLFSIVLEMHEALNEIDRVDSLVFPLLQLDSPFLPRPDAKNDKKLQSYVRLIELVIEQSLKATRKEMQAIATFMPIFEKRVDRVILDLKKRSFALQQNGSDGGQTPVMSGSGRGVDKSFASGDKHKGDDTDGNDDTSVLEEESDGGGAGGAGYAGNDLAYKAVEIDEGLLSDELTYLRTLVWKIRETVHSNYDFGLVYLDCSRFKERIVGHVQNLVRHLERHLQSEFLTNQRNIRAEIQSVEGQLGQKAESIDEVIILLDYIESLKRQDNKVEDIAVLIDALAKKMNYIESVQIMLEAEQYESYLAMRNWPRTFMSYIEERKNELLDQKEDLYTLMRREIEDVFSKIKEFRAAIADAVQQGLVEKELSYDDEDDDLGSVGGGSGAANPEDGEDAEDEEEAKRLEAQRQEESAEGKTFTWLGKLITVEHLRFDPILVEQVYLKVDQLKQAYDEVERATALINKRETLLGVEKTAFTELREVQDDLKPLHELWRVAYRYGRTMPSWVEGRFDTLDAAQIESRVDEWMSELKRLQKTSLVTDNGKQQELQKFVADTLTTFKRFGPMLRTLRTQGLAARHWRMIGEKLGFNIDPARITLYRLVQLELYDEDKLKTTKAICEIASKEHALQVALEALEAEMMAVEFEFSLQGDGVTIAVIKLAEVKTIFEEFGLRLAALKTNPHIRNFLEKLLELERTIKSVVELLQEWASFQKNFLYLCSIFALDEISKALPREAKGFLQIQQTYTASTTAFQAAPQVYRISLREHYLTLLARNNLECDGVREGLVGLLEKKRGQFPRLFFLSNEELVDIVGQGPLLVDGLIDGSASTSFITNLFEGIDSLSFHEITSAITRVRSKEGEEVTLVRDVSTRGQQADSWLRGLESALNLTVKDRTFQAFASMGLQDQEEWAAEWPGQASFLCSQVWFSMRIRAILTGATEAMAMRMANQSNLQNTGGSEGEQLQEGQDSPPEGDGMSKDGSTGFITQEVEGRNQRLNIDDSGTGGARASARSIDQEEAEAAAYEAEIERQITRDQIIAPAKAQLEKTLRLKRRFRVDKRTPAYHQFQRVVEEVAETILCYTAIVKKRLPSHVRLSAVSLLTGHVHFRDVVKQLQAEQVYREEDFTWQMQLKFTMLHLEAVIAKTIDSSAPGRLETGRLDVHCEVFGHERSYGFEYLGNCPRLVVTPLTERCQRSLLIALQYHYGGAPEGPFGTGKTETTKDLARQLAKLCYVMNCSQHFEYAGICRFFKGLASSGAWVCFDEFNRMEPRTLSLLSQVIISIQSAIRQQSSHLQLDEARIPLQPECAIFITLNPGYPGRTELPGNLKALFRAVSMVVPDSVFIAEILLYSAGFVGAQQLAKKIVEVQNLADVVMQKTEIAHDFGLRSIKAIIGIAGSLKLQAQNITDSELAEVIDDATMGETPYRAEQVLKEVMTNTEAEIAKLQEAALKGEFQAASTTRSKAQDKPAEEEPVLAGEPASQPENSQGDPSAVVQATPRNILINQELSASQMGNSTTALGAALQLERATTTGSAGREEPGERLAPEGKKVGVLYRKLWNEIPFAERQMRTVYRQIGIDPDQVYEEEELEEYIILKAVRDYNHSKFAAEEHLLIEGAIKDVFQGSVPDLDKPVQDYTNLQEAMLDSLEIQKLDRTKTLMTKALQFYEIQRTKQGCIIAGEALSGKSTLIHLMTETLNRVAKNELVLAVSELRYQRLLTKAAEYQAVALENAARQTQTSARSGAGADMMAGAARKKSKKQDKDAQTKKLMAHWRDMYRSTALTEEELAEVRQGLVLRGVQLTRLNPKGMTQEELFGGFEKSSQEWREGIFTRYFRYFASQKNEMRKWIMLDGPLDYNWVENLNSILDDNRKMTLPNGESIKMSEGMCVLLETDHMRNITPATVSRCGLIYLHRKETCDTKAIYNRWLRKLPGNLADSIEDLEQATNFLMVEAIHVYEEEAAAGRLGLSNVDLHWVIENFVKLFSAQVRDYQVDWERSGGGLPPAIDPEDLEQSLHNVSLGNTWVPEPAEEAEGPKVELDLEEEEEEEEGTPKSSKKPLSPGRPASTPRSSVNQEQQQEPEDPSSPPPGVDKHALKRKRLPRSSFAEGQMRLENALKYTPAWLEAFMIYSLVWSFHTVLGPVGRQRLSSALKEKYAKARSDFSTYQREKKRKLADRAKQQEKQRLERKGPDGKSAVRASGVSASKAVTPGALSSEVKSAVTPTPTRGADGKGYYLTSEWTDEFPEQPLLISEFPKDGAVFDYWYSVDSSTWVPFSLEMAVQEAEIAFSERRESQRILQNFFVPSEESIRQDLMLECFLTNHTSTVVLGPEYSGRSAILKSKLFSKVFDYATHLLVDHLPMSHYCDATAFKEKMETFLEYSPGNDLTDQKLRPKGDYKVICYIEDLHLAGTDSHGDQPAIEAIRDYLTAKAWLSPAKRRWREIEGVALYACMPTNAPKTSQVSNRTLSRFALVSIDAPSVQSMTRRLSGLAAHLSVNWPSAIQKYATTLATAVAEMCGRILEYFKPTPMKAQYAFSWKDGEKVLLGITLAGSGIRAQQDIMKVFYHEITRNFKDRVLMAHDKQWLDQALQEVCLHYFPVLPPKNPEDESDGGRIESANTRTKFPWPIKGPDSPLFSRWNPEAEGVYSEVPSLEDAQKVVEATLERHNDSNDRQHLDLILYTRLVNEMLKINRALSLPGGHLVLVSMKGYGMTSVIKLVTQSIGHQLRELDVSQGLPRDDWHAELRRAILITGEQARPLTLSTDQYKMVDDSMYSDLELLLKNHMSSTIIDSELLGDTLASLHQRLSKPDGAEELQADAFDEEDLSPDELAEKERAREEETAKLRKETEQLLQRHPHLRAQLYRAFLERVRDNFHVIHQYSPTGPGFRERLAKHKELLYLSQVVFVSDLRAADLVALGQGFFTWERERAEAKAQQAGTGAPKALIYTVSSDTDSRARVLKSIGRMYLQAQDAASEYADEEGQVLYFSPAIYLRIFTVYRKLLKERQAIVKDISSRYEAGLDQIKLQQNAIYRYHRELSEKAPLLQSQYEEAGGVLEQIEAEFTRVTAQREQLRRDELEAASQADEARKIKEECEETLNRIAPLLNAAIDPSDAPTKNELAELRALKKPPEVVKLVMQAVCMLLGVAPAPEKDRMTGKMVMSWWAAATGKEVLGNARLPEMLRGFDRNKLTPEIMMEVEAVLTEGGYTYEAAHAACSSARGVFKWVKATREYFYVFKEVEPRRDAFMQAEKQHEEKLKQHKEKLDQIAILDEALESLKHQQRTRGDALAALRTEIAECSQRKKRADALLKGLGAEKQKWIVCTRMLAAKYTTVTGDVLLSAGFITMLGGFSPRFRTRIIQRWTKTVGELGFQCSKEFILTELFGDSYQIRKWHLNGLPQDQMSINNALVTEKTKQFCLFIDPQMQGAEWLRKTHESAGTLTATTESAPTFRKTLEMAIEVGRAVLVESSGESYSAPLQSLLKRVVTKFGAQPMLSFCRKSYKLDAAFKLYVVTTHPKPHFDANVTNHVTVLNFSVNLECLQAQMLGLVVLNERKDLEESYAENSKEAFESIKALKDVEKTILSLLGQGVDGLLQDETLVQTLSESKDTAEYVAGRLRNIATISAFIQKSREAYAPVAFRAAVLYFAVQDLSKVNPMYQFSLRWFREIFQKAMQITNTLKGADAEPSEGQADVAAEVPEDAATHQAKSEAKSGGSIATAGVSVDDRIMLLTNTLTQEIFKRVRMAVLEGDRNLVSYMFTVRVMQAENFLDPALGNFLLRGTQHLTTGTRVPEDIQLPWIDNLMWADLKTLAKLKPFNSTNLLGHISRHQNAWDKFHSRLRGPLTFMDLPNRDAIDIRYFTMLGEEDVGEYSGGRPATAGGRGYSAQKDGGSVAARTAGDSASRVGSRSQMKRSESAILNDPEIWKLSDTDEEESQGSSEYDEKAQGDKKDDDQDVGAMEMAKYLVERAPQLAGENTGSNIDGLWRRTAVERALILKKEEAIKGLCELCILRCVRPDHLVESFDRFVRNILDPDYLDFKTDILPKWEAERRRGAAAREAQKGGSQATGGSPTSKANKGVTNQIAAPAAPSAPASAAGKAPTEPAKPKHVPKALRGGLNNPLALLNAAYFDSSECSPILCVSTEGVDVLEIITDFHSRRGNALGGAKLRHFALGDGLAEALDKKLEQAAQGGEWVVLENLHLVPDWFPNFEALLQDWAKPETHYRFRVWATAEPGYTFPPSLLEKCVKISLQPARSMKSKMEKMLISQEREGYFRRSGQHASFHKNVFIGLAYAHANFGGRRRYGTLGWQRPYTFAQSDFDISLMQLKDCLKGETGKSTAAKGLLAPLRLLKYYFSEVNYAGRIHCAEDLTLLRTVMDDLLSEELVTGQECPENKAKSHHGFPPLGEGTAFFDWLERAVPAVDAYDLYGFNWEIESRLLKTEITTVLDQLGELNQKWNLVTGDDTRLKTSIEQSALKASLGSAASLSPKEYRALMDDEASLLSLFASMQKLIAASSLDPSAVTLGRRYDQQTDQEDLPKRDLNDAKLGELAVKLLNRLDAQFDMSVIKEKFPLKYKEPLNNLVNRDLSLYKRLLDRIKTSVQDLLDDLNGVCSRPAEIEKLWHAVRDNRLPHAWKEVSFPTAAESLSDFLIELCHKLDYWRKVTGRNAGIEGLKILWLPAFFEPTALLEAFRQTRARQEAIPLSQLENVIEILEGPVEEEESEDETTSKQEEQKEGERTGVEQEKKTVKMEQDHERILTGLALEGAKWDVDTNLLIEIPPGERFTSFPGLRVRTIAVKGPNGLNLPPFGARGRNSSRALHSDSARRMSMAASVQRQLTARNLEQSHSLQEITKFFRCPLYQTTLRLSEGLVSRQIGPVAYVEMETKEDPGKWVKRAVALIFKP